MFHLKSAVGNVHKLTKDARKRDELVRMGYTEVVEDSINATPYMPKKRSRKSGQSRTPVPTAEDKGVEA